MPVSNDTSPETPGKTIKSRLGFRFRRVVAGLLIAALLIFAIAIFLHRTLLRFYAPTILETITSEFELFYDLDFQWQGYSITGINDFTIEGVSITDIPTSTPLIDIEALRIRTSLNALAIRGQDPMKGVTSVELIHPTITLSRQDDGIWNTGTLLEPGDGEPYQFPGRLSIVIKDGHIRWLGGEVAPDYPVSVSQITDLEGIFRLETDAGMGMSLEGLFSGEGLESTGLKIQGSYDPIKYLINIIIEADSFDLNLIKPLFDEDEVSEISGVADTRASFLIGEAAGDTGYSLLGHGTISNGYVLNDEFNIEASEIFGDIHYSLTSAFTTGLSGKIRGADIEIAGQVAGLDSDFERTANLVVKLDGLPASYMSEKLPEIASVEPSGSISAHAEIEYSEPDGLAAVLTGSSNSLTAYGIPFALEKFDATFENDIFDIRNVRIKLFDGIITGSGLVLEGEENGGYRFNVSVADLPGSRIAPILPESASVINFNNSMISADLAVTGNTSASPEMTGVVQLEGIELTSYPEIGAIDINIPVSSSGNSVVITGGSAALDGAGAIFEGTLSLPSDFSGTVAVTVDDPTFISRLTGQDVRCSVSTAGDVSCSADSGITYDGDIFLANGLLAGLSIPNLGATLRIDNDSARLSGITGEINHAEVDGEIIIPLSDKSCETAASRFTIRGFDVGRMLPPQYADVITTSINIDGSVEYNKPDNILVCNITATEDNAIAGPNMVTTGDGSMLAVLGFPLHDLANASFELHGALESNPSSASVYDGRILTDYSEKVISHLTNLLTGVVVDEEDSDELSIPLISGPFSIETALSGIFDSRTGSIDIATTGARVGWIDFNESGLSMTSGDGSNWDVDLELDAGSVGKLHVDGDINLQRSLSESSLKLNAAIMDASIPNVLAIMGLTETENSSGTIGGSGTIEGNVLDPFIENFRVSFSESEVFGIPLSQGEVNFSFDSPMLDVRGLSIEGNNGFRALGEGELDLTAISLTGANMVLRVDEIDLAAIFGVMESDIPLSGIGSASLLLTQDALGARILYDARVENLGITSGEGIITLGDLVMSAEYRPGDPQYDIRKIELSSAGDILTISGKFPYDASDAGSDLVDLNIACDTGYSLSVAPDESINGFSWDGGIESVNLDIFGSIAYFTVNGDILTDLRNIMYGDTVICESFGGPFRIENSVGTTLPEEFTIDGDNWQLGVSTTFRLTNLRRAIEAAGSGFALPGQIQIASVELRQIGDDPIILDGPGFHMLVKSGMGDGTPRFNLKSENGQFAGTVSGNIAVMSGEIDIAELPPFPAPEPESEEVSIFNLDLHTRLVEGFRIRNGSIMNIVCESAEASVTGNLAAPVLTGELYAPSGWIDLFGNHFVLIEPLEMKISSLYPPTDPHIYATGRKTFREVRSPGFYGEELTVTAHIDSRVSTMIDTMLANNGLTSDPPLGQDAIIQALIYEDFVFRTISNTLFGTGSVDPGFESINLGAVLPLATSYLSDFIRREAGFTDFEISMDREQNLLIYIEKEIFNDVVMYYQQKFGSGADDEHLWGARYMWRARSWVGFEINNDEEITPQVQYIIPLD